MITRQQQHTYFDTAIACQFGILRRRLAQLQHPDDQTLPIVWQPSSRPTKGLLHPQLLGPSRAARGGQLGWRTIPPLDPPSPLPALRFHKAFSTNFPAPRTSTSTQVDIRRLRNSPTLLSHPETTRPSCQFIISKRQAIIVRPALFLLTLILSQLTTHEPLRLNGPRRL